MRSFCAVLIYLCAIVFGGALLAPWLYHAAQHFPSLAKDEFHFYVQNSFLLVAIICVWPFFRAQGMTGLSDIGLNNPAGGAKLFGRGFLFGFISLAIAAGLALATGTRELRGSPQLSHVVSKLVGITLTALVVAVLEEILFRGAIFGSLRKISHWIIALLISSGIYAIVHFFAEAEWTGPVNWDSGLRILPAMFSGFVHNKDLFPAFLNLTLAGILLALAYQRTGTLWFSMGLHAGWVFWIKFNMSFTNGISSDHRWFFGSNRLVNGWLATIVLAATLLVFLWYSRRYKRVAST